jgi:hypothetical protein
VLGLPEQRGELAPADEQDVEGPDLVSVGMLIDFQQALEFDEQLGPERLRVVDDEEHPLPLDDHVAEIPPERLREVATGGLTVGQPPLPEDLSEIDQVEGWGGEPPHPHPGSDEPIDEGPGEDRLAAAGLAEQEQHAPAVLNPGVERLQNLAVTRRHPNELRLSVQREDRSRYFRLVGRR